MYQALTVADVSLDDCLEVFRHAELHSDILAGTSHAELIQSISEEHWYNYYFFKGGLGMPDYDAVMKMVLFPGGDQNSFTILGKATPSLLGYFTSATISQSSSAQNSGPAAPVNKLSAPKSLRMELIIPPIFVTNSARSTPSFLNFHEINHDDWPFGS